MLKKIFEYLNLFRKKDVLLEDNYQYLFNTMEMRKVAIISVYDNTLTDMENKRNHKKFKDAMVNNGYEVYVVDGAFEMEKPAPPFIDKKTLVVITDSLNNTFEHTVTIYGRMCGGKFCIYVDNSTAYMIGLSKRFDAIPFKHKIKFNPNLFKYTYNKDKLISKIKRMF